MKPAPIAGDKNKADDPTANLSKSSLRGADKIDPTELFWTPGLGC
jgi:hypothetical protein